MPEPLSLAALLRRGTEERSHRASTVTPGNRPSPQPGNPESSILQRGSSPHAREQAVRSAAECSHSLVFTRARALLPLVKREGKEKKKKPQSQTKGLSLGASAPRSCCRGPAKVRPGGGGGACGGTALAAPGCSSCPRQRAAGSAPLRRSSASPLGSPGSHPTFSLLRG